MEATADGMAPLAGGGELAGLVDRARRGDRSAVPGLRAYLDDHPEVWAACGDLAAQAREALLDLLAGPDLLLAESVRRKLDGLRADLAGPAPTPVEGLLVERVLVCWLQVHHADCLDAQARGTGSPAAARQELVRRQESAHRRYLASLKQLAVVRKLVGGRASPPPLRLVGAG